MAKRAVADAPPRTRSETSARRGEPPARAAEAPRDLNAVLAERARRGVLPAGFLSLQPAVDEQALAAAVDGMYERADEFDLEDASFLLAASVLARYLAARAVPARALPALAAVSLTLACKWCESEAPALAELGAGLPLDVLLCTEYQVLDALEWRLGAPTALEFLERYWLLGSPASARCARFLCLLSAHIALTHSTRADVVAAACYRLGTRAAEEAWTPAMQALDAGEPDAMMKALTETLPRAATFGALHGRWTGTHQRLARMLC